MLFCLLQKDIKVHKSKPNLFRHNFKNLNEALFDFQLRQTDWNTILEIDKKEIDSSFNNFLLTFNRLLQEHVPLKKVSNKEIKILKKPWINTRILKFIDKIYIYIYIRYIRTKHVAKKEKLFELFMTYRNSLNKITKLSKANYYSEFFEKNKKKLNKALQAIKEIININKKTLQNIQNIHNNGKLITNHKNITNSFNNFFVNIPKQIDSKMMKINKKYQDYLLNPVVNTSYLDPTNTEEVQL